MTVEELLTIPTLSGMKLIAGATGIHKLISTVTVIDTPDGSIWIKGNEFVITTAYAMRDDNTLLVDMIRQLVEHHASGLGIKTGRFIKYIPKEALDLADHWNFPLISIPEEYAFCDIINPALSLIVNRQSVLLVQSAKIHSDFTEMAINNCSVPEILQTLSSLLGRPSAFIDIHFGQIYYSDSAAPLAQCLRDLAMDQLTSELISKYDCHPVENKSEKFGYVLLGEGDNAIESSVAQTAIEYASIVLILRMQTRISNQHIEEKYRDAFLEDLILNNVKTEEEIHNRASLYGWSFRNGGLVAVIDINNIKKYYLKNLDSRTNERLETSVKTIFETSIRSVMSVFPDARYYKQSDLIVFIISDPRHDQDKLNEQLKSIFTQIQTKIAHEASFTVTMGVGEYFPNIRDVHQSYTQARIAIDLSYQLERFDCVMFYTQLGIYRLLATAVHTPEYSDFCAVNIRPLMDYDAKNHAKLTDTLRAIVKCGWNLKEASKELFIHYNSVKYRFNQICEVLNMNLRDHENQLTVELALKMHMVSSREWL